MLWKMLKFEALRDEVTLSLWRVMVGIGARSHRVALAFHTWPRRLLMAGRWEGEEGDWGCAVAWSLQYGRQPRL